MEKQLYKVFEPYFKIGAAVNIDAYEKQRDFIKKHFNLIVCENEMKFARVVDENGNYDFAKADKIYKFARENGIEVHAHNFVWHWETRDFQFEGSREEILGRIKAHMQLYKERYPELATVDVINEALDDKHGLFLRESKWLEKLGENYIIEIYKLAREVEPKWKLIYNDYNEFVPEKREKMMKLAEMMKAEGVIDGVGLQSHLNIYGPSEDDYKRCFEDFGKLGLPLRLSELDVSIYDFGDETADEVIPPEKLEMQVKAYERYFRTYLEYHELIDSVTFWGTTDDLSWLNYCPKKRNNPGLLFDAQMKPKAAFDAVCALVD